MPQYRKKPVVIEAIRLDDSDEGCVVAKDFYPRLTFGTDGLGIVFNIGTLTGGARALVGDWLCKGVEGEFYPCKPGIFEQTYEAV